VSAARLSLPRRLTVTVTDEPGDRLDEWDALVRAHPSGDVAQLSGWARTRAAAGMSATYVLVEVDGRLVGGAQALVRAFPVVGAVGYLSYGPLASDTSSDVTAALADAVTDLARRLRFLVVQPPEDGEDLAAALVQRGFRPSDTRVAPAVSVRVDLSADREELRSNLSRRLRTWTNQWEARGVTVRQGTADDLPRLAELLALTASHQQFDTFGVDYLSTMYRELAPAGDLVAFVGEAAGRPVAMAILTGCGQVLKSRLVGFDRSSDAVRLNVPAAVHWAAMLWAKDRGYRWFDFAGLGAAVPDRVDGPVDGTGLAGPDRYKLRFGGSPFRYPEPLELITSPLLRAGYDLVRRAPGASRLLGRVQNIARTTTRGRRDS
jgi:lipid II:glycine glycyltransferase (peptidoglycan interpeptide bridge formation enzyme)